MLPLTPDISNGVKQLLENDNYTSPLIQNETISLRLYEKQICEKVQEAGIFTLSADVTTFRHNYFPYHNNHLGQGKGLRDTEYLSLAHPPCLKMLAKLLVWSQLDKSLNKNTGEIDQLSVQVISAEEAKENNFNTLNDQISNGISSKIGKKIWIAQ